MIIYNTKYRGPFEQDKLLMNALQLSNEANDLEEKVSDNENELLYKIKLSLKSKLRELDIIAEKAYMKTLI